EISNRSDDDRRARDARGRYREHIAVETVGMDDIDPALGDVSREACLVRKRFDTSKRGDVVLAQWNAAFLELADETSLPAQTGEFQLEATRVEGASERHELSLGAAVHQRRNDFQQPDASGPIG